MPDTNNTYTFKRLNDSVIILSPDGTQISDNDFANLLMKQNVVGCYACNQYVNADSVKSFTYNDGTVSFCAGCAVRHILQCSHCDCLGTRRTNLNEYSIGPESSHRVALLCGECVNNYYGQCNQCGYNFESSQLIPHEGRKYCVPCGNRRFPKCKYCDNRHVGREICRCGKTKSKDSYLPNIYFSTELEIIDPDRESTTIWSNVHDGSLSGGGVEYLSGPMVGSMAVDEISEECSKLSGFVDDTCGFHIHIDFGENSEDDVKKYAAACQRLEAFAFDIVRGNRKDSRFCKRYGNMFLSNLLKMKLDHLIYQTSSERDLMLLKKQKYQDSRYHWFNLHSYYFRGTVEMRQHHGTKDPATVLRWAELWLKVADWSKKQEIGDISNMSAGQIITSVGLRSDTIDYFNNKKLCFQL